MTKASSDHSSAPLVQRVCLYLVECGSRVLGRDVANHFGTSGAYKSLSSLVSEFGVCQRSGYRGAYFYSATVADYHRLVALMEEPVAGPDCLSLLRFISNFGGPVQVSKVIKGYPGIWPRTIYERVCRLAKDGYLIKQGKRGRSAYQCSADGCQRLEDRLTYGVSAARSDTQVQRARAKSDEPANIRAAADILESFASCEGFSGAQVTDRLSTGPKYGQVLRWALMLLHKAGYLRRVLRSGRFVYSATECAKERFDASRSRMNNRLLLPTQAAQKNLAMRAPKERGAASRPLARAKDGVEDEMDYPKVIKRDQGAYRVAPPLGAASSVFDFGRVVNL